MTCPPPLELPPPRPQKHLPVKWKGLYVDGVAYAALTMQDYENLTRNNGEINRWEEEVAGQIREYLDQRQTIIKVEP